MDKNDIESIENKKTTDDSMNFVEKPRDVAVNIDNNQSNQNDLMEQPRNMPDNEDLDYGGGGFDDSDDENPEKVDNQVQRNIQQENANEISVNQSIQLPQKIIEVRNAAASTNDWAVLDPHEAPLSKTIKPFKKAETWKIPKEKTTKKDTPDQLFDVKNNTTSLRDSYFPEFQNYYDEFSKKENKKIKKSNTSFKKTKSWRNSTAYFTSWSSFTTRKTSTTRTTRISRSTRKFDKWNWKW